MKKTETKTKSSKVTKTSGVSVKKSAAAQNSKSAKPAAVPKKEALVKSKPAAKTPAKAAAKPDSKANAKAGAQAKTPKPVVIAKPGAGPTPRPGLSSGGGRKGRPRKRKPAPVVELPPSKYPSGRPKTPKTKSAPGTGKGPAKLIQVVPKQKPAVSVARPVNKEKILMRYGKPTKRVLFSVDFLLKASPTIVYQFMTTPSALVRWFCDAVDITGEYYTFSWKGSTEVAELIDDIEDERLRFTWLDGEDEDEFFEFRLTTADITDETILEIFDFAWIDEVEEQKQLWRTQVEKLRRETGDA